VKRSEALAALSRDHHHALDTALRLRRAGAAELDTAVAHLQAFWEPDGRRHFEIEEELILPALPESDDEWREATARIRDEHARIRARVAALPDEGVEAAHELGELLRDHVRYEERHLFALLEQRLPEAQLAELGAAVERAEAAP
jgi:hemerythrin-like domain-containing protein